MLAIEADGGVHRLPEVSFIDKYRQNEIENYGVHFLRFENKEIKRNIDSVLDVIENWIKLNANDMWHLPPEFFKDRGIQAPSSRRDGFRLRRQAEEGVLFMIN